LKTRLGSTAGQKKIICGISFQLIKGQRTEKKIGSTDFDKRTYSVYKTSKRGGGSPKSSIKGGETKKSSPNGSERTTFSNLYRLLTGIKNPPVISREKTRTGERDKLDTLQTEKSKGGSVSKRVFFRTINTFNIGGGQKGSHF